ncbi:MAG: M20 family metallopeptidase [Candidatus Nanopelagicaceae bacterium]|nr:M20 family metallopeptidase [Candidatus Nanopelagicaceae bacterium]
MLDDLKTLVTTESPTDDLAACRKVVEVANEITQRLLGTKAEVFDEKGRPVYWLGSKNPQVVFLAHLDTVWPTGSFTPLWQVEGDVVRGPGIYDMKAGFIQALYATKDLDLNKVALIATTDEETGSATSRELIENVSKQAKAVLVLESAIDGKVKIGRKGTSMYKITIHGRAAHAGLEPEKGINATVEIAAIVNTLMTLGNNEHGTTVVPTVMNSGTTTNTVPALASLDIDCRSFKLSEMQRVQEAIKTLKPIHPEAKIEVTGGINRPPLETSATTALYEKCEAVAKQLGQAPLGSASVGGASDGNFAGIHTQVLDGLGAVGNGAHATHEHILASYLEPRSALLAALAKEILA